MRRPAMFLLAIAVVGPLGCQTPQQRARERLAAAIRDRDARGNESMDLFRRAKRALHAGDEERAAELLNEAVRTDPRNAFAWIELGVLQYRRDDVFDAAVSFNKASELAPRRWEPHYNLGILHESLGYYPRAEECYETALELAPGRREVVENLARCYVRSGRRPQRARELIDRALADEPTGPWKRWLGTEAMRLDGGGGTDRPSHP